MNDLNRSTLLIGQRSTPNRGTGIGLTALRPGSEADTSPWQVSHQQPAVNPGSQVLHPDGTRLYVAHGDTSQVSTYRVSNDPEHPIELLSTQDTGGTNPAHLCLTPSLDAVIVANHTSGSLAALPLDQHGEISPISQLLTLEGTPGPHQSDQPGPKPHQVAFTPDGAWLAVPDKGLDAVHFCIFDAEQQRISVDHSVKLREISGPRHIAFHPHRALGYVVNELDNTVVTLDLTALPGGRARAVQILPTPPATDVRDTRAAEILVHPHGERVYVSNRSGAGDSTPGGPDPDWIAVFTIGTDGTLTLEQHLSSEGIRPRFMCFSPDASSLLVANERSGTIVRIPLSPQGVAQPGRVMAEVASPVHILDINSPAFRS